MDLTSLAVEFTTRVVESGARAHGLPIGSEMVSDLLRSLLQVQDDQAIALERIGGSVDRLIQSPWEQASFYIDEARVDGQNAEAVADLLGKAADKLREAVALQEKRTLGRAYASLDLAFVLRMTNSPSASMYTRGAVEAATGYMHDVALGLKHPPGYEPLASRFSKIVGAGSVATVLGIAVPLLLQSAVASILGAPNELKQELGSADRDFNAWLDNLRVEVDQVVTAAAAICGDKEAAMSSAEDVPGSITFRYGEVAIAGERRKGLAGALDKYGQRWKESDTRTGR